MVVRKAYFDEANTVNCISYTVESLSYCGITKIDLQGLWKPFTASALQLPGTHLYFFGSGKPRPSMPDLQDEVAKRLKEGSQLAVDVKEKGIAPYWLLSGDAAG
jgi:hypothetical protein